jgi:hypothetical protein
VLLKLLRQAVLSSIFTTSSCAVSEISCAWKVVPKSFTGKGFEAKIFLVVRGVSTKWRQPPRRIKAHNRSSLQ